MATVTVVMDGEIRIFENCNDHWGFTDGDVEVSLPMQEWFSLIDALQDWLGECPHCGKLVGAHAFPAESSPSDLTAQPATAAPATDNQNEHP